MWSFPALCDEFYINARIYLKLDLDPSRESLLHFLEQIQRAFPGMSRLRRRESGGYILDEDPREGHSRRAMRLDVNALKLSHHRPNDANQVRRFAEFIFEQAPSHLTLSPLDFDFIEVTFGFDLEYRGNHDELVADTLFPDHPLLHAFTGKEQRVIDCQPFFGIAASDDCERQVDLDIKGRTTTYEVRTEEFESSPLSVLVTARQYWGYAADKNLIEIYRELLQTAEQYATECAVPFVVQPLAAAIASRR